MAEQIGIQVKIDPQVAEGAKKVDQALENLEKHGEETGKAIERGLAGGIERASAVIVGELRKERQALVEVERAAKESEAAERKRAQALQEEAAWEQALTKAQHEHAAATGKLIDEARRSIDVAKESKSAWGSALDRWKDVTRTIGDVGNALNAVKQGIELVRIGFETSKKAAAEAIAVWRSMDNSGPSAYVGADARQGTRLAEAQRMLQAGGVGGTYSSVDALPKAIAEAVRNTRLDNTEFEAIVLKYIRENKSVLDEANREFQKNFGAALARQNNDIAQRANAERAKAAEDARKEAHKAAGGGGGGREISGWDPHKFAGAIDRAQSILDAWMSSADGLLFQIAQQRNSLLSAEAGAAGLPFTSGAIGDTSASDALAADAVYRRSPRRSAAGFAIGKDGDPYGVQQIKQAADETLRWAEAFEGPLASGVDGLLGRLTEMAASWDFSAKSMEEWGRSFAAAMAEAAVRTLILKAILSSLGNVRGTWGGFLTSIFGGETVAAPDGKGNARRATRTTGYGDPFGGGATSGAVWRDPVMPSASSKSTGGDGGGMTTKVVVVANMQEAALEAAKSPAFERAVVSIVHKNRGKLGS